jgi:hypothetical protein
VLAYSFGPTGSQFNPPINITLAFDPATLPPGTRVNKLQVAWWDGTKWTKLSSVVDLATNTITAQVSHFTDFAIIGEQEATSPAAPPPPAPPASSPAAPAPAPVKPAPPASSVAPVPAPALVAPSSSDAPAPAAPAPAAPDSSQAGPSGFAWGAALAVALAVVLAAAFLVVLKRRDGAAR